MKILKIKNLEDIMYNSNYISNEIKKNGAIIIRNAFDKEKILFVLKKINQQIKKIKKIGTTAATKKTIRKNSCKWSVGGNSGAQIGLSRLMLILYNPISASDKYKFRSEFEKLIKIRDYIRNDGKLTNDKCLSGNYFNACRFQIYPKGGGFMIGHTDYDGVKNSKKIMKTYFQTLLFMTERGKDFKKGGAYILFKNKRIDIEKHVKRGDVVVYDGKSYHGVDDIDPNLPFSSNDLSGRVVALTTIYK
jgi:hypothetical protein